MAMIIITIIIRWIFITIITLTPNNHNFVMVVVEEEVLVNYHYDDCNGYKRMDKSYDKLSEECGGKDGVGGDGGK